MTPFSPLLAGVLFLYSLFSDVFKEHKKGTPGSIGLKGARS